MIKTAEFTAFFNLYNAVMSSDTLTLAEKTAAIEAAFDEYSPRLQPAAFRAIAMRLAALPPREPHASRSDPAPTKPKTATKAAGRARSVASRIRRKGPGVSQDPRDV